MIRRYFLPVLAALGLGLAIGAIFVDNRSAAVREPDVPPAGSPFEHFVAGAGLVEASTGNISLGTPVSGIVIEIDVRVGDRVDAGEPLFRIDDRDLQAQLVTARARVDAANAALLQPRHRLDNLENLSQRDRGAVSTESLTDLRDQVAVAEASLRLASAEVSKLNLDIERRIVRAPVTGRVLQLNLRVGEFVNGGTMPTVLFGEDRDPYVRVQIDESDAWRVRSGASAVAFMRGRPDLPIPLSFEYLEPYVVPKASLTGRSIERTDTRVLQILYSLRRDDLPVYLGQQLDVFIEAPAALPPRH